MFFGIVYAIAFVMSLTVIELTLFGYRNIRYPDRSKISKRLAALSVNSYEGISQDILKKRTLSEVPLLNRLLEVLPGIRELENLRRQANAGYPLGFFILLALTLSLICFLAARLFFPGNVVFAVAGLFAGGIPFGFLTVLRRKRMDRFMNQLPEALDLIGRSLRAGHAFTSGMKMVSEQFDDPLGPEFGETLDEINFGVSVQDALKSLTERVDCPDLKFFVVSVLLQRETGGNLSEIIESIAHLIRERFKFNGKVRTLAAEGKLSAIILIALPILVFFALCFTSPDYIKTLMNEASGRKALYVAGAMMVSGILMIRRIIQIRV